MENKIVRIIAICLISFYYHIAFCQNVGVGTTTPTAKLHIKGTADVPQLIIDANSPQTNVNPLFKLRKSDGTDLLWLHSDDSTNCFLGLKAGRLNVLGPQGVNNSFIGSRAGYSNTNGRDNTALGTNAFFSNTKGGQNIAIGTNALFTQSFAPGATWYQSNNVAVGFEALYSNQPTSSSNGVNNTAIGTSALRTNSTGTQNTAVGMNALLLNTIGFSNTANGYTALNSNTTAGENTAVGTRALFSQSFSNNGIGWISGNTAIGFEALYANQPTTTSGGINNTAVGHSALFSNTIGHGNTSYGFESMLSNTTGIDNTAMGIDALQKNISGNYNVAIGNVACINNMSGSFNTTVGGSSLGSNTTGSSNTALGEGALSNLVGGSANVAVGRNSGTAIESPNVANTISIGNDGYMNAASNQAFIGNLSTTWTGGQTTWFTYASDARVKNNVKEDVQGLAFIERLRPVTYNLDIRAMREITGNKKTEDYPEKYDIEEIKQSGFLAQEVEQAAIASGYCFSGVTIPKNENELYTMSYAQFVVPLVKAVQEQQTLIVNQQTQIDALVKRIEALEKK